jgi:hypothetical protein
MPLGEFVFDIALGPKAGATTDLQAWVDVASGKGVPLAATVNALRPWSVADASPRPVLLSH